MAQIKCKIGRPGCKGSITVTESVAPDATYTCSKCNVKPEQEVFFQEFAFDRELSGDMDYSPEEFLESEAVVVFEDEEERIEYEQRLAQAKEEVRE